MHLTNDQTKSKPNTIVKFETDDNFNQIVDVKPMVNKPKKAVNVQSSDKDDNQTNHPKEEKDEYARYSDVRGDYCVYSCQECDWCGSRSAIYQHIPGGKS